MILNKKISFGLASAVLFSAATAFAEGESVEAQQSSLLHKLDSLNAAVLGLKLNGSIKAGGLTSMAKSDQFSDDSPTQENQGYTDANLMLTARPSSETQIHLELRLHKDWQSAYDENNNPVLGHWFSYDGSILNKHLDFNLGYMRVGFTPYTLYTPQQKLLQEPEIFAQKRVEALAMRNLDTTTNRLMHGLNADFHSGNVGPLSDIHAQVTGARMRNAAKKTDQVFFDFDFSDRYFYGLRLGADAYGAHLGVNYTDVFDRVKSRRSRAIANTDTVYYEDNAVFSAELGFDSKELLSSLPVSFGLNGEFAKSWWNLERDYNIHVTKDQYSLVEYNSKMDQSIKNMTDTSFAYLQKVTVGEDINRNEEVIADEGGVAFYVEPFVNVNVAGIEGALKVMYLQNEEKFWSEMASSPAYRGSATVLNANAMFKDANYTSLVDEFGIASLENMYFSIYNSNPLQATNLMTSYSKNVLTDSEESNLMYSRLFNNYKNSHFYRNGYNADVLKRLELAEQDKAMFLLDPANDMALPMGVATPDRKGLNVNLDLNWNSAVELNAIFGMISTVSSEVEEIKYTRYGAGLGVDVGRLAGLDRKIKIQGSYDHSEEDKGFQRKNDRIMAGLNVDVIGPLALLAGYQMATREFGIALPVSEFASINKAEESLLLVGPRLKISPNSYLSVQYGMLTDKVTFQGVDLMTGAPASQELSIDKNVIIADVTVNF